MGPMLSPPNLFTHARSELAQDAVLAWLLEWAAPQHRSQALHELGTALARMLFKMAEPPVPDLEPIEHLVVETQWRRVDLRVVVNKSRTLIVEDKVTDVPRDKSMEGYRASAEKENQRPVHCVYVKTAGPIDRVRVGSLGYGSVGLPDLVPLLRNHVTRGLAHPVVTDFLAHLERTECALNAWRDEPLDAWSGDRLHPAWKGLFNEVYERCAETRWDYTPNAAGGHYYLTTRRHQLGEQALYLQLDSLPRQPDRTRFQVRLLTGTTDRHLQRARRDEWQKALLERAQAEGWPWHRPKRRGSGNSTSLAVVHRRWLVSAAAGGANVEHLVDQLDEADVHLSDFVAAVRGGC